MNTIDTLRAMLGEAKAWAEHNGADTSRHDAALREMADHEGRYFDVKPVRDAMAAECETFRLYYAGLCAEAFADLALSGRVSRETLASLRTRIKRYGLD